MTDSREPYQLEQPQRAAAPLATVALAVALLIPLLNLLFRVVSSSILASRNYDLASLVAVGEGLVVFALAVVASVLGAMVLARRSPGRARAGAAIGVAALSLWGVIVGLINGALLQAFLG